MGRVLGTIGQSVLIKGVVSATEDLTIEGRVEGKIELGQGVLTVGQTGQIEAEVLAKVVNVSGKVDGDITATEAINISDTATVDGALMAPRVGIEEGAAFRGQIDISVNIPLQRVLRRLKPEKPHVRLFRRLVGSSFSMARPEADPCQLFGVSSKLAEATMRVRVGVDSRPAQAD